MFSDYLDWDRAKKDDSTWTATLVANLKTTYQTKTGRYDADSVVQCTKDMIKLWQDEWVEGDSNTLADFESFYKVTKNRYKMSMSEDKR